MMKTITFIRQPHRTLTISHGKHLRVREGSATSIVVEYVDHCNTCEPVLFDVYGDVDLSIEINTPSD